MVKRRRRKKQPTVVEPTEDFLARLRINELLDERGWTLQELSNQSGVSLAQLSNMARNQKGFSRESLERVAKALGTTVPQLFEASWQHVPVFGVVEDNGHVRPLSNGTGHPTKIKAPAVYGPLLALTVVGDAMYPRYLDKDIILCAKAPAPPEECIGKECVVQIENGQTMLRWVHKGASTGKYVLTSHNQPPIVDATIILARPVIKP